MKNDTRNMILAIVLSIVVLFGWQYFVAGPAAERAAQQAKLAQQQQQSEQAAKKAEEAAVAAGKPAAAPTAANNKTFKTRAEAIAATPRLKIDTPNVTGSINLSGGRLDDLELKQYHVDVSQQSPLVTLLSPATAADSYFIEEGWITNGAKVKLPGAETPWTVDGGVKELTPQTPVTLTWDNGEGLVFHRTFAVDDQYLFTVTQTVDNKTDAPVTLFPYAQVIRHGTPEAYNSFILHEGGVGVLGSHNLVNYKYEDLRKAGQEDLQSDGGWLGFDDKYFGAVVMPEPQTPMSSRFSWSKPGATDVYKASYVAQKPEIIAPGASATDKSYTFAGAKVESTLVHYETKYNFDRFDLMIDWGWFWFLTKPVFNLIQLLHGVFGNFGLAILGTTVIVKLIFFPLANRSYASMAAMRRVQPEMKLLQEKFKDDRAGLQQATMALYKREKVNPVAGCWPMFIQIPVFYALYTVLFIAIEMRHAPFFGWIQDLAAPDPTNIFTVFGLFPWNYEAVPVVGHFLNIGIWPLVMGVTMWVQMRLNPPPPDPTQQAIFNIMPVIFTFTLGTFPAGLVIYYAWNNTLSIIQQTIIMKRHGVKVDLLGNILSSFRRTAKADKAG
jgi:YidC/Oxa1 family membrane protein insertase